MDIRKTQITDVPAIMKIIDMGKEKLKSLGTGQWQNGYPNAESIQTDISNGESYVITNNEEVVGTMALSFRGEPTYNVIDGKWLADEQYGVIHRIAVDNNMKGKGIASTLLEYAQNIAIDNNINYLRIDTHEKNEPMIKWIINNDFIFCGTVIVSDNTPRNAYEKNITI